MLKQLFCGDLEDYNAVMEAEDGDGTVDCDASGGINDSLKDSARAVCVIY